MERSGMTKTNQGIFREYDIRGIVGKELTEEFAEELGRALAVYLNADRVVVGRDNRPSSLAYKNALVKGLLESGVSVVDIGMVPTPLLYYALRKLNIPEGVMITGSHNPPEYNGFKIAKNKHCIYGKEIQRVREIIEKGETKKGKGSLSEAIIDDDYINEISSRVKLGRKLVVVADTGNGTAGPVVSKLLEKMGATVTGLFMEPDGTYPNHHPDPTQPQHYTALMREVKERKADVGLAYDGDADRLGAVDDKGRMRFGDELMILFSREILGKRPGAKIAIEVKCSQAVVEDVESHGGVPIMCPTGHSLIEAKMEETGALLAGEMSGHIYFADEWYGFDDAIYASARLLRVLSENAKSMSEMLEEAPRYFATPEIRIEVPDEKKFEIVERIKENFRKEFRVIDIDGVRFITEKGWGLVRASNTQPALVVRAEGKTEEELERIKEMLREELKRHGVEPGF